MRVLSISLDPTIAADPVQAHRGDTLARQLEYAARLERYAVITKSAAPPRTSGTWSQRRTPAPGFTVAAIDGPGWLYLPRALLEGRRLAWAEQFDVVTAQDPWLTGMVAYALHRRYGWRLNLQLHSDVLHNPHWRAEHPLHRVYHPLAKWLLRRADTVRVG